MASRLMLALSAWLFAAGAPAGASAQRLTLVEENDAAGTGHDRDYTQGIRLSLTFDDLARHRVAGRVHDLVGLGLLTIFSIEGPRSRQLEWIPIGQSIFTPDHIRSKATRRPDERPFAGWLYTGVSAMQSTSDRQLDSFEILAGVVGPAALGEQTQEVFHRLIGRSGPAVGNHHLHDEPGIVLSWERRWKLGVELGRRYGIDLISSVGLTAGNVYTYGAVGGLARFGRSLSSTWGPTRVRPGPSGGTFFTADALGPRIGWDLFAGVEQRAVAQNVFLDGNTFRESLSVSRKPLVTDLVAGFEVQHAAGHKLALSMTSRSREYDGQPGRGLFGSLEASFRF